MKAGMLRLVSGSQPHRKLRDCDEVGLSVCKVYSFGICGLMVMGN